MIKQKLLNRRKEIGKSQEDVAFAMGIEQSQYSKREAGQIKITKKEWETLAKILMCTLEDIYEPEDGIYVINNENANGNFGNNNIYNAFNEFAFETMRKYITKLEEEITVLKEKLQQKG